MTKMKIFTIVIFMMRYLSGESDVNFNHGHPKNWDEFKKWCMEKQIDIKDKTLSPGWCFLGDLNRRAS